MTELAPTRRTAVLQSFGVLLAWLCVVLPHTTNDGLWYVGDAARHALNGLFWSDLLAAMPSDPKDYLLRYYARYPAITPVSYPPLFYLLEAVAFRLIAPSALVAKGLVLGFALVGALVVSAWLRRYIAPAAGWGGVLFLLQPGIVAWSNAVMLNLPSMTIGIVALYCARRWIDAPAMKWLLLTVVFAAATALTYFPAALLLPVAALWLADEGRWRWLWRHRFIVLIALLLPITVVLLLVGRLPLPFALAYTSFTQLWLADKWLFYLRMLPKVLSPWILALACLALPAALIEPRVRRDVRLLLGWLVPTYLGLSYFWSREARYALLLVPPLVMLAVIGVYVILERAPGRALRAAFVPLMVALIALQGWTALRLHFPAVDGFAAVARFVVREAPTERVLYEGRHDGTFTFYLRAADPEFRRGVVRASKLLYASAVLPKLHLQQRVASVTDVLRTLENDCGCGWIVIERAQRADEIDAIRLLRETLQGPQFRLVRSFEVHADSTTHVDVYEFLAPFRTPDEMILPFPMLGDDVVYHARPITR
jgi:hypothetical protein